MLGAGCGTSDLAEGGALPAVAFGDGNALALAGTLVVAAGHARPSGQMVLVGELVHVDFDLGDERLGGGLTDVGNPIQQRDDLGERAHLLLDLLIKIGDKTVERLDMCSVQAQHEAMMRGDVTVERLQQ